MALLGDRLQRSGFKCESINRGAVTNLWARRGTNRPLFCFAGHVDVVPSGPADDWLSDPFQPSQRDGRLYGRGAADMKSSLAAFVTATENFIAEHPNHSGSIAFLLTSDEEGDAIDGTCAVTEVLAARGENLDFCVIGEPTAVNRLGDTIKTGRRGSLSGELTIKGVQGHIAYPHLAKNPIHLAAPAISELAQIVWDQGHEFFPATSWQISSIRSDSIASNVIPGRVDILFNFRFAPVSTVESLKSKIVEILDRHNLDYTISWTLGAKPFLTERGVLVSAVREAIREETGIETILSTTGGTSDGRFIAQHCPQVVEIGPVNTTIHKINECVEIEDLPRLSAIYTRILNQLLP